MTEGSAALTAEPRPEPLWKTWDALANKRGEHATVFHTNGDKYRGQYEGNLRHGAGTLLFKSGDKYEGEFRGGLQHGFGTHWVNKDGQLRLQYRGGFGNGKRQGQGILAFQDGGKYDGEWMGGRRHGQGKMIYIDGSVYKGLWAEGKRHGPGVLRVSPCARVCGSSNVACQTHSAFDARPRLTCDRNALEADASSRFSIPHLLSNYPASHAGTLFLPNGDIFQGEYAFDLKDGPGTFFYVSKNKRYDGVWSKDVGKCGLYGTIELQDDDSSSGLPRLTLLEPMGVLEDQAYSLQEKREMEHSMVLGDSGYGNTGGYGGETWQEGDVTGESQQEYIGEEVY